MVTGSTISPLRLAMSEAQVRAVADAIQDATFVQVAGVDTYPIAGDVDAWLQTGFQHQGEQVGQRVMIIAAVGDAVRTARIVHAEGLHMFHRGVQAGPVDAKIFPIRACECGGRHYAEQYGDGCYKSEFMRSCEEFHAKTNIRIIN